MKSRIVNFLYATFLALAVPLTVYAQEADFLILRIRRWIVNLTPALAGLALLVFFWGVVKFIFNAGDEEKRREGKKFMLWGIIALFVMVSLWGIVTLIRSSVLGTGKAGTIKSMPPPTIDSPYFGDENELQ